MNLAEEKWETVKGFPNYMLSTEGRVMSKRTGKLLKPGYDKRDNNYIYSLSKNGKGWTFRLYRLVATHFIPNPENKPQINHINGDRMDSSLENLEWCNNSENMLHAFRTGLRTNLKLSPTQAEEIRKLHTSDKISKAELGRRFNVRPETIARVINRVKYV